MFKIDHLLDRIDAASYLFAIDTITIIAFSKDFVVQDIGISSRVFSHWVDMGLIDVPESKIRIKRTFSLMELIWLKLVKRLRDFGYPIEKIRPLKETMLTPFDIGSVLRDLNEEERSKCLKRIDKAFLKDDEERHKLKMIAANEIDKARELVPYMMTCLMFSIIVEFLLYRRDVRILIDLNGESIIDNGDVDNRNIESEMEEIGFDRESYLNISILSLFKSLVSEGKNIDYVKENRLLNENELHILSLLREGKAKSITIKFKNQKPNFIEVTQERKVYAEARLSEVMLGKGYQDITIKTENGTIAVTNITTRKKLDD
ncbi:MAG: helix-turn-helix domain-containing protein [Bacteroidetes bacterium]|nr:helix-turn-helix domain-containing protein [Bacteroidota bacterium]